MFGIDLSQHALQSLHLLPCLGAGHMWELTGIVLACTVEVFANRLGAGPSTIGADTLTTRLSGSFSLWLATIFASRVGTQC